MNRGINRIRRFFSLFCGISMILVSMNIIIFSAQVVSAEGGELEINLNEIGFATEFTDTLSTNLYCPRFEQSSNWETQIILSNPSENTANVNIYYYSDDGQSISQPVGEQIQSSDTIDFISTDHNILEESGSIYISSDIPIFGDIIYYSSECAAAEQLQTSPSSIIYCPGFYQTGEWETWLCVKNVDGSSTDITYTYYDDEGTEIDSISDDLASNEIRYFRPIDDYIETTLGSVIIESETEDSLVGYTLKIKIDGTKSCSFPLVNELLNHHGTIFITTEENTGELFLFNPESVTKTIDLILYDEEGTQINSISEQLSSYETLELLINDYDEGNSFGSVLIESDNNGIVGYSGHIGENYALANSIKTTIEENFYTTFKSYKEPQEPAIYFINPTEDETTVELTLTSDNEDEPGELLSNFQGFGFSGQCVLAEPTITLLSYNPPKSGRVSTPPGADPENPWISPFWLTSPDTDNDGLDDHIELRLFPPTQPITDTDGDGTADGKYDPDTDDDSMQDGWEYYRLFRKQSVIDDGTTFEKNGKDGDPDSDNLKNHIEYNGAYQTYPRLWDTDGDCLSDKQEIYTYSTHPLKVDPDKDGLSDSIEVFLIPPTEPWNDDTDSDGMEDGWEYWNGLYLGFNSPDPRIDDDHLDPDDDLLTNINEMQNGLHPNDPDHDLDGRPDGFEYHNGLDPKEGNIEWTIMIYLNGDNDLEEYAVQEINTMEIIGTTDDITIIVQIDRTPGYYTGNGNWQNTRRYLIRKDSNNVNIGSHMLQNMGELNMGAQSTLNNFQSWGRSQFPAQKYALFLWNHGKGWKGLCYDETSYDDITMSELKSALPNGQLFDIIAFDACYMGNTEVFYQIRDKTKIAIGSENYESAYGYPYQDILDDLDSNPTMTPSTLADIIVTDYIYSYTNGNSDIPDDPPDNNKATLCAVDIDKFKSLAAGTADKIHKLADILNQAMSDSDANISIYYKDKFDLALENPDHYWYYSDSKTHHRDLYYFADWLRNSANIPDVVNDPYPSLIREYATDVKDYLDDSTSKKCFIAKGHGSGVPESKGLSIYLPGPPQPGYQSEWNINKNDYNTLDWAVNTDWNDMLETRY